MSDAAFSERVDDTFEQIEDLVDQCETDIDCELSGGVMTLKCEECAPLIFSRQSATQQLWLAARSGGYHFEWRDEQWVCTRSGRTLVDLLSEASQEQFGEAINLD